MEARTFMIVVNDTFLMKKKIQELVESLNEEIEIEYHSIEDDGIPSILALLNTPSLLFGQRLIVITDAYLIESKVNDDFYMHLLKYITNPASFSYLALIFNENKETKRFQELKKYTTYIELKKENLSIEDFINNKLKEENFEIEEDALNYLLTYGNDNLLISNLLDSLICYKINEKVIKIEDVKTLFLPPLENNVFELTASVLRQDSKMAFKLYHDFKTQNFNITFLLGLLINKFQELYNVTVLYQSGMSQTEIADAFKIKPGRAYFLINEAKRCSLALLKNNLEKLNAIEFGVKNGSINGELAFSTYLLSI